LIKSLLLSSEFCQLVLIPRRIKPCGLQSCSSECNYGYTWINGYFLHEQRLPFTQKESWL